MNRLIDGASNGIDSEAVRVLLVSASIGGGHDGAAAEFATRFHLQGSVSETVDFLSLLPPWVGRFVRSCYRFQLRAVPLSYELLYRMWFAVPWLWQPFVMFVTMLSRRRISSVIRRFSPDVVVSTYPLSSLALGRMRKKRWLRLPVVTYLTDPSVHPLWLHPSVDLHLATSSATAAAVTTRGIGPVDVVAPMVRAGFLETQSRHEARGLFAIPTDAIVALIVAGSWGVGDVLRTARIIAADGRFLPVVACGRNDRLRQELIDAGCGIAIGWTAHMASLMAGCDVVVENAGGLTCMEAFASGVPVVSFEPIPGHGRDNARVMETAGLTYFARSPNELVKAVKELCEPSVRRFHQLQLGRALFGTDGIGVVTDLARTRTDCNRPLQRHFVAGRSAAAALLLVGTGYGALTDGAAVATERGVGTTIVGPSNDKPFIAGVRLSSSELSDDTTLGILRESGVPVLIDAQTAASKWARVDALAKSGVRFANAGSGQRHEFAWAQAQADTDLSDTGGQTSLGTQCLVTEREVNAFDVIYSELRLHQRVIAPSVIRGPVTVPSLHRSRIYVVDETTNSDRAATENAVQKIAVAVKDRSLSIYSCGPPG